MEYKQHLLLIASFEHSTYKSFQVVEHAQVLRALCLGVWLEGDLKVVLQVCWPIVP
jgi:hypothetical protein